MNRPVKNALWFALAGASFTLSAPLVSVAQAAEPTPAEIVKMMDKAGSDFKDLTTETKLIVKEPGASTGREYQFVTISRGAEKRVVRFTAPGDVKGMGMLVEGRDTMYAYLPGFDRVRRLGTHVKNQSFMGSDASFEDMAAGSTGDLYDSKLLETTDKEWVVELTLKPGKESEFPKRKMWVDKGHHQATRMEDFDAKGTNVRSQFRSDFRKDEGPVEHWTPYLIKIVDHRRNDHTTEMIMLSSKVNQNVPDEAFSQRSLIKGR